MIHVSRGGEVIGEFSEPEFQRKIFAGEIAPDDHYWCDGMADWKAVSQYRVGTRTQVLQPPPLPDSIARASGAGSAPQKKKTHPVVMAFGIVFGCLIVIGIASNAIDNARPPTERKSAESVFEQRVKTAIENRKIVIGMTKEQVIESWGDPNHINRTVYPNHINEQMVYGNTYLYIEDGVLTSFQDTR